MLAAIKFDDQPGIAAYEIDDVAADLMLPAELPALQTPGTQAVPQGLLGIGLFLAQVTCSVYV
jgi:hypothetical protein